MNGVNRLYLQEYLDEVMWRHNECRTSHKDPKKELKNSRKVAFSKMLKLISTNNVDKLVHRIEFVEQENAIAKQKLKEQKNRKVFNSDEFVIRRNRIKNIQDLIEINDEENDEIVDVEVCAESDVQVHDNFITVGQISRSSQTDASSFDYKMKRKKVDITTENDKAFDVGRCLVENCTQTEWSPFADALIKVNLKQKIECKYNLRNKKK
jgi:hypothetical protein